MELKVIGRVVIREETRVIEEQKHTNEDLQQVRLKPVHPKRNQTLSAHWKD